MADHVEIVKRSTQTRRNIVEYTKRWREFYIRADLKLIEDMERGRAAL